MKKILPVLSCLVLFLALVACAKSSSRGVLTVELPGLAGISLSTVQGTETKDLTATGTATFKPLRESQVTLIIDLQTLPAGATWLGFFVDDEKVSSGTDYHVNLAPSEALTVRVAVASAAESALHDYSVTGKDVKAKNYQGEASAVALPYGVTALDEALYRGHEEITEISLPATLCQIGANAFDGTGWLNAQAEGAVYLDSAFIGYRGTMPAGTMLTLKAGTRLIASSALSGADGLAVVNIPDSVLFIGAFAFAGCTSLVQVKLPANLKTVSYAAFRGCSRLVTVELPAGLTTIETTAFGGCNALHYINFPVSLTTVVGGALELADWYADLADGAVYVGHVLYTWKGTMPTDQSLTVAEGTTMVASGALYDRKALGTLVLPDSLVLIADAAFAGCSALASVTFGEGLTTIGSTAFRGCTSLASLSLPSSLSSIEQAAFVDCTSLSSVTFADPDGWTAGGEIIALSDPAVAANALVKTKASVSFIKQYYTD